MAQLAATTADQLKQLDSARTLVLGDAHFYSQIVSGVLPIIGPQAKLELRRWGADFLAEAFANPTWSGAGKEQECAGVLPLLKSWLDMPDEDQSVVKGAIQTVASIFPFVFRRIISRPEEGNVWEIMTSIKSNILGRMDSAPTGVRICCIKFVQKVVQVLTPGIIQDPRRPEQNETSISLVSRNHPILTLPNLEAEASGLLDRLLDVFHENSSDAILINSTLNCVAVLIKTRPAVANKIISVILNYNPLKLANSPMNPALKVSLKSMERTTRAVLKNVNKTNPSNPLAPKIEAYLLRLQQSRNAVFADTASLKRAAPSEPTDGLDNAKRARLAGGPAFPPLSPPPNSFAQLFTLTEDDALAAFDVKVLPIELVSQITTAILAYVDEQGLERAISEIKSRYAHLQRQAQVNAVKAMTSTGGGVEDEDDYDPDYEPEMPEPEASPMVAQFAELVQPDLTLGPFELPKPPPLSEEQVSLVAKQTIDRVLGMVATAEGTAVTRQKLGLNRLAASSNDRDSWVTMMIRLATRAPSGLEDLVAESDSGSNNFKEDPAFSPVDTPSIANGVRHTLFAYILQDFRARLNHAIIWLNEEWYAERLASKDKRSPNASVSDSVDLPTYTHFSTLFLRTILPYLDARAPQDTRLLIRFLSEIPSISSSIVTLVESLAEDPERISMCVMALQYLVLLRPPIKEQCLDVMVRLWRDNVEARQSVAKILTRFRPDAMKERVDVKAMDDTKVEDATPGALKPELVA